MNLKEKIEADIKTAMLAKAKDELRGLRSIKSMILIAETEKGAGNGIDEATELKLLTKAAKQRKDSIQVYEDQGRSDLAEVEKQELQVIERYLPEQMSAEELESKLKEVISQVGASGPQDMGKVMGMATKQLAGKADGKAISEVVKKLLT